MVRKYFEWTVWARDETGGAGTWCTMERGRPEQLSGARSLSAPERAESVGASELAQGVCDIARTDRDGGYPCS